MLNELTRHVRIAIRGLARTPAFTISAVLILGVGIGTAAAMFTVFRAVLVERLPVTSPDRLVVLSTYKDPKVEFGLVREDLKAMNGQLKTLVGLSGYVHWGSTPGPLLDGERSIVMNRTMVTGNFFDVIGVRPYLGRLLHAEDELADRPQSMVISYAMWRQHFGGDSSIIGRGLVEPYEGKTWTIVGVVPPGFDAPQNAGFWLPMWGNAAKASMIGVGRLAPGATAAAAQAEFYALKNRLTPELNLVGAHAIGFVQTFLGDVRPVLIALSAAVGLLLLIACVNVGNLLLLRASGRARELAIRRALGATYGDIVRQLLTESALLAIAGGVLGLVCANVLLKALVRFAPAQLPRIDVIQISGAPILAALAVTVAALVIFGVGPALLVARGDVASTLRLDARSGQDSAKRRRVRYVLVASQTALALVMLSGTMLLARSLARLQSIPLGYESNHLSMTSMSWPVATYGTSAQLIDIGETLIQRYRAIPGVTSITPVYIPPLLGANVFLGRLDLEGQTDAEKQTNPIVPVEAGNGDYFKTFGIPIIRGRAFTDADRENTERVAVVSEAVARRAWPNQNPIGKRISYWTSKKGEFRTVIGVVGEVRLRTLRESTPAIFLPWRQTDFWQGNFAVRTARPIESLLPAMRRETLATNPQLNLWYARSMDRLLDAPLAQPRMSALLMSAFGLAALLLAAIGLYGVMASVVRESTREIGIRMALGAVPERLRRDVLGRAFAVSSVGAIIGILIALGGSRVLAQLLYEVSPTDPLALGLACVVLLGVVLVAAYVPARRATKIDPALALRSD